MYVKKGCIHIKPSLRYQRLVELWPRKIFFERSSVVKKKKKNYFFSPVSELLIL